MSLVRLSDAMMRIRLAQPSSPIAVFSCELNYHVDAMFANTAYARQRIACCDPRLIGVYHCVLDPRVVAQEIRSAIRLADLKRAEKNPA